MDMGLFCLFCWFSRRFLQNQKHLRENQKIQKKTKENKTNLRENQNTKLFKGFRPTLGYGFVLFVLLVFPKVFLEHQQHLRENKQYKRTPKKTKQTFGNTKQTKFLKVSDLPLDMGLFLFVVCWFSRRFLENQTNI